MKSVCIFFLLLVVAVQAQPAKSNTISSKKEISVRGRYFLRDSAFVAELKNARIAVDTTGLFTFRPNNPESFVRYAEALRSSSDRLGCEMEWSVVNIFANTLTPQHIKRLKNLSFNIDSKYITTKYGDYLKDALVKKPNETYVQSSLHTVEDGDFSYPIPIMFGSKMLCYLAEDGSIYEDWHEIPVDIPEEGEAAPADGHIPDNWREIQHKEYLAYVDTLRHQYEYLGKISVKDFEEFERVNYFDDIEEKEEPEYNTEYLPDKRLSEKVSTDNTLQLKFDCLPSQAQRINADGRKLVKSVNYSEWKGNERGFVLRYTYTMMYNDKDELVRLYYDQHNGFSPISFVRKGEEIIGLDKGLSECIYKINQQGHIISANEYGLPHEKDDPYYHTYTFDYNENGKLSFVTDKTFYNIGGQKYKETPEDRELIKFEYKYGGAYCYYAFTREMYSTAAPTEKDFRPWHEGVRYYDTNSKYDINFNIEALVFAKGYMFYAPWLTEWSPTFPECLIQKTDNGGTVWLYNWEYDQNGNIIAMTITYGSGGTHGRYEIEYVY